MEQNKPSLYDVIAEPNLTVLNQQAKEYGVGWVLEGKFIRIGELPLIAPHVALKREPSVSVGKLFHADMIHAGLETPDRELAQRFTQEQRRVLDAKESNPGMSVGAPRFLMDAGWFEYQADSNLIIVSRKSDAFNRADDAGRTATVDAIQAKVGPEVLVVQDDDVLAKAV